MRVLKTCQNDVKDNRQINLPRFKLTSYANLYIISICYFYKYMRNILRKNRCTLEYTLLVNTLHVISLLSSFASVGMERAFSAWPVSRFQSSCHAHDWRRSSWLTVETSTISQVLLPRTGFRSFPAEGWVTVIKLSNTSYKVRVKVQTKRIFYEDFMPRVLGHGWSVDMNLCFCFWNISWIKIVLPV